MASLDGTWPANEHPINLGDSKTNPSGSGQTGYPWLDIHVNIAETKVYIKPSIQDLQGAPCPLGVSLDELEMLADGSGTLQEHRSRIEHVKEALFKAGVDTYLGMAAGRSWQRKILIRFILHNLELHAIPWEEICFPSWKVQPFAADVVRTVPDVIENSTARAEMPPRLVAVALDEDRDGISQLGPLEAHQQSKIIEMPCPPIRGVRATTENILGALREAAMTQPAIIHVVGGSRAIDDGTMALGLRSLDGDIVYAEIAPFANELQASFHDKPVAMVVLNVCAGARAGTTHGIAEALLRAGVQAVVAYTRWPSPKVTATVSEALYENLFKHHQTQGNIAAAVSAVRRRLDTQVLTDSTGRRESTSLVVYLAGRDPILFAAATNFVNGRTPLPSHNNEPTSTVRAQSAPMYQVVHTQSQPTVWPQQTQTVIIQQPLPPPPPPNAANSVAAAGILGIVAALGAGTVWVLQETLHGARLDEGASCEYAWQCNEGLTCSSGKCAKPDNGSVGSRTLEAPALGPTSLQAPLPQQNDPFRLEPQTAVVPKLLLSVNNFKPCPRSTNDDKPVRTFDTSPPNSPTGSGSSRRPCDPPAAWDGRPRGWAREGPHCLCAETKTGYYLRVDEQNCQRLSESFIESSKSAIANRWGRYEETYLRNGEDCPKGEVIFIARTFCGVGILFPEKPPHWDELVHKEHGWMLRDQGSRPITEPRCFFPVSDQTYQDPSTAAPSLQNLEP